MHVYAICNMARNQAVCGMKINNTKPVQNCEPCLNRSWEKRSRGSIPKENENLSTKALQMAHSDVCFVPEESVEGSGYFVTFIDDSSKNCSVYTLKEKSEVITSFKKWLVIVESQLDR